MMTTTTTEFGTPMLPGANNEHTTGRRVDTYDRGFGGPEGSGLADTVDQTDRSILRHGKFTGTGYHKDGFVVEDFVLIGTADEGLDGVVVTGRRITRSVSGPVVTRSMAGGLNPDVEESQIPGAGLDAAMAEAERCEVDEDSDEEMEEEDEDEAEESEWDSEPESEEESEDESEDESDDE